MMSVAIGAADRHAVRDAMARLTPHLASGSWLPPKHTYSNGVVTSGDPVDDRPLAEYLALSAVQHAFDGWAYWGRAVAAQIAGDSNVASHLGYYAEVRAAKAILASEGIGLSRQRVAVVDGSGRCVWKPGQGSSHRVLWDVLEEWSRAHAGAIILRLLKPFGHSIAEWLRQFPESSSWVAEQWLHTWGLDLKDLAKDGSSRNVASYEPSGCPPTLRETSDAAVHHIARLWRTCQPTGPGVTLALDRLILRATVEAVFRAGDVGERTPREAPDEYCRKVRHAVASLSLTRASRRTILDFLDPQASPQGMAVFEIAKRTGNARTKTHVSEVLARAVLLLRLATACAHDVLTETGDDPRAATRKWWDSRHVRRGLWAAGGTVESFSDLWDEADEALEVLEALGPGMSAFRLRRPDCTSSVATLATAERIFLWGSMAA